VPKCRKGLKWESVSGCPGLYRLPSGSLYMRFRVRGEEVSEGVPSHLSVRQAKELVRHRRHEAAEARLGFRHDEHSLERLAEAYFGYKRRRLKRETVRGYEAAADRFLGWLFRHGYELVSQVDVDVAEDYSVLREGEDVSNRTINLEVDAVRRMLSWGVRRWRRLRTNPLSDWERLPERGRRRRAFTAEEYELLAGGHRHPVCGALGGKTQACRSGAIWVVFGETGLRPGELGRLEFGHVDWGRGTLYVPRGKTASSERTIWLSGRAVVALAREAGRFWCRGRVARGLVFRTKGGRPVVRGLWGRLRRCLSAAGIESEGLTCHSFRHFFASRLLAGGVDLKTVQALLGHASSRMTTDVYAHEVAGGRERAAAALDRAAGRGAGRGFQLGLNAVGNERGQVAGGAGG